MHPWLERVWRAEARVGELERERDEALEERDAEAAWKRAAVNGAEAAVRERDGLQKAGQALLDALDDAIAGADLEAWDAPYRIEASLFNEAKEQLRVALRASALEAGKGQTNE